MPLVVIRDSTPNGDPILSLAMQFIHLRAIATRCICYYSLYPPHPSTTPTQLLFDARSASPQQPTPSQGDTAFAFPRILTRYLLNLFTISSQDQPPEHVLMTLQMIPRFFPTSCDDNKLESRFDADALVNFKSLASYKIPRCR